MTERPSLEWVRDFLCPAGMAKVLIIGLAIRLAVAPWTSYPYDVYPFYSASVDMLAGLGMYGHATFSYPPGFGLILYPFMLLLSLFVDPSMFGSFQPEILEMGAVSDLVSPFITAPAFNLAFKLPMIIGDVLAASMLFLMVREWKGEGAARSAYALLFLNPLVIWIGSVMGQFDILAALCTLVAVHLFIHQRYALAGLALGAGALIKIYPAYLAVFFLAYILLAAGTALKDRVSSAARLVAGTLAAAIPAVPLLLATPEMIDFVFRRASNDAFGGINPWFLVPLIGNFTSSSGTSTGAENFFQTPMFLMLVGLVLAVIASVVMARSDRLPREGIVAGSLLVLMIALMFRSITNPQHLLWVLPFMLLFSFSDKRMRVPAFMLTASGLLFFLALRTYAVFLYPLAVYTPLVSVGQLNSIVFAYFSGGNLVPTLLLALSSIMGVVAVAQAVITITGLPSGWFRKWLWGAGE
ncbi:hypothetical protein AOA80_05935 [Methanomassiliicoccales archaeon RumEn M1]|nr:hypothetical protein AOA80_05935 [Methanomassiliicoccales archaeon RumEn M1]